MILLADFMLQTAGVVADLKAGWPMPAAVFAGILARVGGMFLAGGLKLFPGVTVSLRVGIVVLVALAATPAAVSATQQSVAADSLNLVPMITRELLIGCGLGMAVAMLVSVAEMAGGILASVAGLNWADAFTPGGSGGPGVARLCGWLGLASFVAAGGQQAAVSGLLDSFWAVPVGETSAFINPSSGSFVGRLVYLPSLCLNLAFAVALPVLVAVMTTHVVAAICLRSVEFTPGPGLLQGIAAIVLLGGLIVGSQQWSGEVGQIMLRPLETTFESVSHPAATRSSLTPEPESDPKQELY